VKPVNYPRLEAGFFFVLHLNPRLSSQKASYNTGDALQAETLEEDENVQTQTYARFAY
jgi:hypothetical protein